MAEVSTYIQHHLRLAGSERVVFTIEAVRAIATMTRGTPRLINTICDLALFAGARRNADSIDGDIVMECAERLGLVREGRSTPKREVHRRGMLKPVIVVAGGGLLLMTAITGYLFSPWERAERAELPAGLSTGSMTPAAPPSVSNAVAAAEPQLESGSSAPRTEPPARASVVQTRVPESLAEPPERQVPEARSAPQPDLAVEPPRLPRRPAILLPPPASPADTLSRGLDQPNSLRAGLPTPARGEATAVRTATREGDDAMDPTAIIDWVLRTHPARQN